MEGQISGSPVSVYLHGSHTHHRYLFRVKGGGIMHTDRHHTAAVHRKMERERRQEVWPVGVQVIAALVCSLALSYPGQGAEFSCASEDVACLIEAIHTANVNGEANTITLAAGSYTLPAINNPAEGANGLPSITSPLTIQGAGAGTTILEQDTHAQAFPLVHVGAAGALTLKGLTLRGENAAPAGSGLINIGGTVILTHSSLADTRASVGGGSVNQQAMLPRRPRIAETDLTAPTRPPASPQRLEEYLAMVQKVLKQETASIQQAGFAEVTLTIQRDGSVRHTEIVPLDGPATLRSQLLAIVSRLGPWPPPPVDADVLVVTVPLPTQYPGADLRDSLGLLR
jgi:hypothetical protein